MCNSAVHRTINGIVDPFGLPTLHFLRTCNRFIMPTEIPTYFGLMKENRDFEPSPTPALLQKPEPVCPEVSEIFRSGYSSSDLLPKRPQLAHSLSPNSSIDLGVECPVSNQRLGPLAYANYLSRRQRGEKRPIPEEQKDDKYYERRKRNNEAAKKSRDARKLREDRIAFRAAILEQENAFLRAQLTAMREEMVAIRQVLSRSSQGP